MSHALNSINRHETVQTEQARHDQVINSAGGYVFQVSDKSRLERFLVIGTDSGTYYTNERELTRENVEFLTKLIATDEQLVRETLVDVSVNGRAYKQNPVIFTLALLLADGKDKAATRAIVNQVLRTSTHLFQFAQYVENLTGWGRSKRTAVAQWYLDKSESDLAYQLIKYRQRNGWTHADLMRLSHPVGINPALGNFALGKAYEDAPKIINDFAHLQLATTPAEVVSSLLANKSLPWEAIPTDLLKSPVIWKTLFYNNALNGQALVRNITRLARLEAFNDLVFARDYANKLTDVEMIKRTRLHPIQYLLASVTHSEGQSKNGGSRNKDWTSSTIIGDALDAGFDLAFKSIVPANKRTLVGLDISGSMGWSVSASNLTPAEVGAALSVIIARSEPYAEIRGFSTTFVDLGIGARTSYAGAVKAAAAHTMGGTDMSLPITYALENKIEIDTFVAITDNETYAGSIHPFQALKRYRDAMGIDAKVAVFGVTATPFTIADPSDSGMMDFVGFDAAAPSVLADFSAGRL